MDLDMNEISSRLAKVQGIHNVQFILLYGSTAEGRSTDESDIDLAVYYEGTPEEAAFFRYHALKALDDPRYDLWIFQQLPLYIRIRALRGKILYCKDIPFLYTVAYDTIRDYDAFKHRLFDYIGEKVLS
jgi:Predicted nucleotidyltransferases